MLIDWFVIATYKPDALQDTIVDMEGWAMPLDADPSVETGQILGGNYRRVFEATVG
ncbi:hypothetical protein [Ralstonia holmesii]|uniref:hypothetical protein n=1 Tax=Ralstonia holmesii TaxID=3058602 RepID=UPI0028F66DB7|nr:hypothetical protein [Ralstonia sp. LMG 32967]CAJ0685485.1 hypothetical protein R11007_00517 [Ralstonia sp. LMG 32967]